MSLVADPTKARERVVQATRFSTCKNTPAGGVVLASSFDGKIYRWAIGPAIGRSSARDVDHGDPRVIRRLYSADFRAT